jgi:hypothetical protein
VDVAEEVTRSGYMRFLENCVALTVEEGGIEEQEIVDNMQRLFDPAWHWQLKEIEEYKFLVRFPPHKKIAGTLISDITYFKMNKLGVMVSLRAWNGDIKPYDTLDDVLVQISGIPSKWSTWKTFIQISSTLGNLLEVEWNSVFASFFVMVRVKLAYKDVSKVPKKKLFEMQKKLYLIQFKVEGEIEMKEGGDDNDNDDGDQGDGYDNGIEEYEHDPEPEVRKGSEGEKKDSGNRDQHQQQGSSSTPAGSRRVADWVSLFQISDKCRTLEDMELGQYSYSRLLQELEAVESDSEHDDPMVTKEEDELVRIPDRWLEIAENCSMNSKLPMDLYTLPEVSDQIKTEQHEGEGKQDKV